ncbi:PAS domain-containing protein [Pedobacter sp. Leaf176]|uniref:PAS domain-containing protein n=1 Tax=Pedobacter sp. Leaf176 TaxID=1736286 RepID=UPI0006FA728E|nr:PAS domain-containing protein [Pedobacter sp. Leaf176]KQR65306.1 PAS domain-containing sensor histidine kinase [Pedobacter sp. Leaf176]
MNREYSDDEKFSSLVDSSPMPTAIYKGRQMVISFANQAMIDLWGKDESVIGMPLKQALPELDGQPFHDILAHVFDTGETYYAKESSADLVVNGRLQTFYFTFTYKPIKDCDGQTYAIINTAAHLTELVSARKEIAETQERLAFALQSAGIGTWDLDPINSKVNWDNRCRELFGFSPEGEIAYEDVLSRIYPDDEAMVNAAVIAAVDPKGEGNYDIRYRTLNKEINQLRWVHCKGKAYFNAENIAYRFAGIAQDVTSEVVSKRREQQLMSLVSHNADHMTVADMEGNLIYMNAASRNLLGVGLDADVTKLSAKDFYTPEELDRVQNHIIKEITETSGWQGTINLRNFITKEIIPCNVNYLLIKDPESGDVIGRGATARDLRPEIKAKAELQRLATIVDSSEDFCNYCDIQGNTFYINPSGIALIGIDEAQISKSNLFDYHSEATNELIKREILPVLLSKGKWSGELELLHQKTGEIIPIHKQLYAIREEITNTPVAIAGIARDLRPELNARKILNDKNEALQRAFNELEFLANTVPSIVWTSRPDGTLDYINQRWYDQSGRPKEEVISSTLTEAVHPDDKAHASAAWAHALETGDPYETEYRIKDRFNEYRWFLVRALPLKNAHGEIVKWYGTNTDVHHQKELEKQKDDFLGIASHELKTPVTSLKAYSQVLEAMFKRSGDLKNAEFLSRMNKQVDRLTNLIGDLLDVTKINAGRLQFNHSMFDFNEMVEEVIEDVQRTSAKHIINKNLKFKRAIFGDRERVCQVVTNLLTNAVKYSPDANEVVIYTEDHEEHVRVCVQDYGIGISSEKKDHVFEQFYRVSGNKEHTFPGLGLGLYISSEIVKRLKGKIWVNSVEGKGSTFCFSIPVKQEIIL